MHRPVNPEVVQVLSPRESCEVAIQTESSEQAAEAEEVSVEEPLKATTEDSPQSEEPNEEVGAEESATSPPAKGKGKAPPPPKKGKGKGKGPPLPTAEAASKGKGKSKGGYLSGSPNSDDSSSKLSFNIRLQAKHDVAAFQSLDLETVQLKEEDWNNLLGLFHTDMVDPWTIPGAMFTDVHTSCHLGICT